MPTVFRRGPLTASSNNGHPFYLHQISGLPAAFTQFLFDKKHYGSNSKSSPGMVHAFNGIEYSLDAATKLSLELLFFNNPDRIEKKIWIAVQQFFSKIDNSTKYRYICTQHINNFDECVHPQLSICYQPSGKVDILATEITKNYPYIENKTLSLACQEDRQVFRTLTRCAACLCKRAAPGALKIGRGLAAQDLSPLKRQSRNKINNGKRMRDICHSCSPKRTNEQNTAESSAKATSETASASWAGYNASATSAA